MKANKKMMVATTLATISLVAFGSAGVVASAFSKETEKTKINYEIGKEL